MNARFWNVAAALCLVASAIGCKQDDGHSPAPAGPSITMSAAATSVVANGTNTVQLSVTDTGGVAVTVTTDRGSFTGGGQSYAIPAGSGVTTGTATLVTCNSGTNTGCAGVATVTATSTSGQVTRSINFTSLAATCASNCGADPGCAGQTCTLTGGGSGTCSAGSPSNCAAAPACVNNPPTATTETSCTDDIDNDCNGKKDCEDTACDGLQCKTGAPTFLCVAGACTDVASGLALTVTPARAKLPANGTTQTDVTIHVTSKQQPAANMAVTIATTLGTLSATSGNTDANGDLLVKLTAPDRPGVAVITATSTLVPEVSATATVVIPRLGSIQIPVNYATHPILGVKTSGWNEFGAVAVQVLDDQGLPYPDGQVVRFEHRRLGGSTFGEPLATTNLGACTAAAGCVAYDAAVYGGATLVDASGLASAPLFSGITAGTLVVTATTTAGGDGGAPITKTATLPGIAVIGAKANLANFSIQCSPRNVPALAETDCSTSWVDAQVTCAALRKDRFNNLLATQTEVIFASEAGAVGQVAWTKAYDPTTQGSEQADLGTATQIFQTLGAGLPFDVDPLPGVDALGNPIEQSVVHGYDHCGPRTHNPRDGLVTIIAIADGEEAFFDANGNGVYDAGEPFIDQGEPFIDQDDDGVYTPGEWFADIDGDGQYTPANGQWDAQKKIWTQTVVVYTGYPTTLVKDPAAPTYLATRWVNAADFEGACVPTPPASDFVVFAKVTGPPDFPPTSESYVVVASDWNLNRLTSETTYAVTALDGSKVKAAYYGLKQYADFLGMNYQYWPCDRTGSCASQCRATGAAAPCTMTPAVGGFSCGISAGVSITGGDEAGGVNIVDFNVDTPYDVYLWGTKVILGGGSISGDNL